MGKNEPGTGEKQVDALLTKADQLLTAAEGTTDLTSAFQNCREAVRCLLLVFLFVKGERDLLQADQALASLWHKCVGRDPEILQLADNIGLFQRDFTLLSSAEEVEIMLDSANEVWDFIFGSILE